MVTHFGSVTQRPETDPSDNVYEQHYDDDYRALAGIY